MIAAFALRKMGGGDDFWAHAALGRWALDNHQVPRATLFLWSADIPWIFHSWLSGVFYALLLATVGTGGILAANILSAAAPFAVLYRWWSLNRPVSTAGIVLFAGAIYLASPRFYLRTEAFTMLFLSLLVTFILTTKRRRWHYVGIAVMFALWPNLHGGVLMGMVMLWAGALAELAQFRRAATPLLVLALVCTLLVFLCNPWGFGYARTWSGLDTPLFHAVNEWKPFWEKPALTPKIWAGLMALWGVALLLWSANRERRWACLIWLLIAGAAFMQARRQMWLASLISLLVILANSQLLTGESLFRGWRAWTRGDREAAPAPLMVNTARAGAVIVLAAFIAQGLKQNSPIATLSATYPTGMSRYLLTQAPPGRIFNDYEYSAALEWLLRDRRKLYIDLINAYPPQLLFEYFEIAGSSRKGKQLLDERQFDIVALRPRTPKEGLANLAKYLDGNSEWTRTYNAKDGTIWVRKKRFNAPLTPIPIDQIAPVLAPKK